MRITVDADFPDAMLRELKERAKRARDYPVALERAAIELQGRAREHASGRPGPNIITWQFWSAYTYAVSGDDAVVGNGSAYANRLEFGFVGVDAIGRHYCVDMQTHALTTSGWRSHDQLAVGDQILTINPDTWLAEWQPITHLWHFDAAEVNVIEGRSASIAATDDHRWLVERYYGRAKEWRRGWYTTADMPANARIPLAAKNADLPHVVTIDDDVVELIGWFWTEGSYGWAKHHSDTARPISLRISQSLTRNPTETDRIMRLLARLLGPPGPVAEGAHWHYRDRPNGVRVFTLDRVACWLIERHVEMPHKALRPEFLLQLTQEQLDLLIEVSMLADGHDGGTRRLGQANAARIEGWEMACILAGHPIATRAREREWATTLLASAHSHAFGSALRKDRDHARVERRIEPAWCPTTANGTWLAKRNGTVYFTGNSQPPYPSLGPAVMRSEDLLPDELRKVIFR